MKEVVKWFKKHLKLSNDFYIEDVHTQKDYQRNLREAGVTLSGGADISIGPSKTPCVWIETKKKVENSNESQAIGELFLIDKLYPIRTMTVLTDCKNYWKMYFFATTEDKNQYITTCELSRGMALTIIKDFVCEEKSTLDQLFGKSATYEIVENTPLRKKAKFLERISEADDENRMADLVGDMSEQELFNMSVRKRLMLVRDFCKLSEQPQVDKLIAQFSDNYENPTTDDV
jgi:hypothetical protein